MAAERFDTHASERSHIQLYEHLGMFFMGNIARLSPFLGILAAWVSKGWADADCIPRTTGTIPNMIRLSLACDGGLSNFTADINVVSSFIMISCYLVNNCSYHCLPHLYTHGDAVACRVVGESGGVLGLGGYWHDCQ